MDFGVGCRQTVLYPLAQVDKKEQKCFIGLTDPSDRKRITIPPFLQHALPALFKLEKQVEKRLFDKIHLAKKSCYEPVKAFSKTIKKEEDSTKSAR